MILIKVEPDVPIGLPNSQSFSTPNQPDETSGSTCNRMHETPLTGSTPPSIPPVFPERLHHEIPGWVKEGSAFHLRFRVRPEQSTQLTDPKLAQQILLAVQDYHHRGLWHTTLFLLMPDHAHALIAFPPTTAMSTTVANWKRYTARNLRVKWQINYFDHRIRNEAEQAKTWCYILQNPTVKGLCSNDADWPWVWTPASTQLL